MREISEPHKNRDVEVLRALAILLVLAFHWAPHPLAGLGRARALFESYSALWSGVDLFFCISGFVITTSLLRDPDLGSVRARFPGFAFPFWIRRLWRLWPSAWLWIAISVALACWFNSTGLFGTPATTGRDALMAVLNVYNFHGYACTRSHSCGALSVYWSLSLEEQFYFVFPFLVFFLPRRALIAVLFAIALSQCALYRPVQLDANTTSLLWLTRTDAICYGALIALWRGSSSYQVARPELLDSRTMRWLVSGLLTGVLAFAAAPALGIRIGTGILGLASAVFVWIASYGADYVLPRIRIIETVVAWLGSRSYSLYLTHEVGARLSAELRARVPTLAHGAIGIVGGMSLTILLTAAFSEWNFRYVELPLRRIGRDKARKSARDAGAARAADGVT